MNVPESLRSLMELNVLTELVKNGFAIYDENTDPMYSAFKTLHGRDLNAEDWVIDMYEDVQKQVSTYGGVEVRYLKPFDGTQVPTRAFVLKGRIKDSQKQFKELGYKEITREQFKKEVGPRAKDYFPEDSQDS